MADVIIIGDGPGGLSAALFLAKCGKEVTVFAQNESWMHKAMLYNYLGIPEMTGTEFQQVSRRQVEGFGAAIVDEKVTALRPADDGFTVETDSGQAHAAPCVVLATGTSKELLEGLDLARDEDGHIAVDRDGLTSIPNLYAIGWLSRRDRVQAIISAGDGAAAALAILSAEAGKDVHDFDTVESE